MIFVRRFLLPILLLIGAGAPALAHTNEPWRAAVRIKVDHRDGQTMSIGSGTIVLSQDKGSLVLTCAHIFDPETGRTAREFAGRVTVDLFDGKLDRATQGVHFLESVRGDCLDFDRARDVGLVWITPGRVLEETRPDDGSISKGERLIAVGCPEGRDATAWSTEALYAAAERGGYAGTWCKYAPKQGRSGGGLHRMSGHVVGVCDFANAGGFGIYASPTSIKAILDRNGYAWIYPARHVQPTPQAPAPDPPGESLPARPIAQGVPTWVWLAVVFVFAACTFVFLALALVFVVARKPSTGRPEAEADLAGELRAVLLKIQAREEQRARLADVDELLGKVPGLFPKNGDAKPASAHGADKAA